MKVKIFRSAVAFRAWLRVHSAGVPELWVGFYNQRTTRKSITYPEALDEALCFGWIDDVRKSVNPTTYTVRFTPRKPKSTWSALNAKRMRVLMAAGRVEQPGLDAFEDRAVRGDKPREQRLGPDEERLFRGVRRHGTSFRLRLPGTRERHATGYGAQRNRRPRLRRLQQLIEDSRSQRRLAMLTNKTKGS
jgi:hypothetical protein